MAKRRTSKKRRTSRKKQGVSILGIAETVMLLNVASQAAFNTTAYQFLTEKSVASSNNITLSELINPNTNWYQQSGVAGVEGPSYYIMNNIKTNWMGAAGMMIAIPLGFKFAKQLGKPAISRTNRLLNKAGVGSTVKL
jgi:hypothetical protein